MGEQRTKKEYDEGEERMNDWEQILTEYKNKSVVEQHQNKELIVEAFREMWESNPNQKDFCQYISGLVIFPECMYIMVKQR